MTWQPGDRAPDFVRRDGSGQPQAFDEFPKGRPCLLVAAANPADLAPQFTALPPHLGTVLVVAGGMGRTGVVGRRYGGASVGRS